MSRIHFTKKLLEALPVPKRTVIYRDATARGLGLKIEPSGHRTFFWSRRVRRKLEWKTVGEFEAISLEDARGKSNEYNAALARWKNADAPGENPFARPQGVTLGGLIEAYTERHIRANAAKPDRAVADINWMLKHRLARWRDRRMSELRRADLVALHEEVHKKHGTYSANRLLQMVRAAIFWAMRAGLWQGANPAQGVRLFREKQRQRFLLAPELKALWTALEDPRTTVDLRHYVLSALLTGARKSDVLSMRWADVALERATWRVPLPKNQEPYTIALTREAVRILEERQATAKQLQDKTGLAPVWVFPSHSSSGHCKDMKRAWKQLLKRAGITDLRQHDLRRTLGSWQAASGASLSIIGKSLGHKSIGSTQVYAQLQLEPIRASVELATAAMLAAAKAPEPPKQLPAAPVQKGRRRA